MGRFVKRTRARRGFAAVVIIVVLSVLSLAVAGSIVPVRQEADLASLRVQTTRAFFAADSGAFVLIGTLNAGLDVPTDGSELTIGAQNVIFDTIPEDAGDATITGYSGQARRRIRIGLE